MLTDPIADFLTRIRNARLADHDNLTTTFSNMRVAIAKILKSEGYINDFTIEENEAKRKSIVINLAYRKETGMARQNTLSTINRVSKPGRRVYVTHKNIPRPLRGIGTVIISTSQGLITGKQAYKQKLGGEIICEVW